ncbi:MAG: alginate export family protein [Gammaproteobacteria bacterium]
MRASRLRPDPFDPFKYMPLTQAGETWFSLGGELRERYEYANNPAWGDDPQDPNGVFLQRYVLHGDLHVGPRLRFFGQLFSALESGRAGPPSPIDENELDLQQAFVDLSAPLSDNSSATLRLGRQEMSYGSARLIDVREGPNVRRKFDGGRVLLRLGRRWYVDAIFVRPSEIEPGVFDDGMDHSQALWGAYTVGALSWPPTGLDLYYLGYESEDAGFDQGVGDERRHTLGTRLWGERGQWDWNWELIYQWGRFAAGDLRAWSVGTDTGYTWQDPSWSPRLGVSANVASGDRDPADPDLQTFNPLFPRGNYFSELALLGPRNFFNLHPFITISPTDSLELTADADFFWRLERTDGIYTPSGRLLRPAGNSDARYVGTELSLNATWQVNPHLSATAIYAHFFPGRFIAETGASNDIDFVELTVKLLF